MDFILNNLAIGNFKEAQTPSPEIAVLLCVAQEKDLLKVDLPYYKVPIIDMKPIPAEQLKKALDIIADNIREHRILIFCNAGVGRSPSVVVGYLCCKLGYGFGQAVEYVATRRPYMSILPNLIQTIKGVLKLEGQCRAEP